MRKKLSSAVVASMLLLPIYWHVGEQPALAKEIKRADVKTLMDEKQSVVFAVRNVRKGTRVTSDMVELRRLPAKDVPGGALWTTDLAVGLVAKFDFTKGTLLTTHHFGLDDSDPEYRAGAGEPYKRMTRAMQKKIQNKCS
ncbi:MAG TPA: SAF domain-containing protein [Planktothrix sp.]|jgi:Flp pilus assembly protein CpaB